MEKKPAIEYLQEELNKTIVLSEEFKTRIFIIASTIAEDSYLRGKEEGFKLGEETAQGPNLDASEIEDMKRALNLSSNNCTIKRCGNCGGLYNEGWESPYCDCGNRNEDNEDEFYWEIL